MSTGGDHLRTPRVRTPVFGRHPQSSGRDGLVSSEGDSRGGTRCPDWPSPGPTLPIVLKGRVRTLSVSGSEVGVGTAPTRQKDPGDREESGLSR